MLSNLKYLALKLVHLVHRGIDRFWIHPIESNIIPRLESARQTRLNFALLKWFSWWANLGRVIVMDLRVDVKHLVGSEWSVTYIGGGKSLEVINTILFPESPKVNELPRVFLWQVPALIRKYTGEGDLVVCELNEIVRLSPIGQNTSFVMPLFIKQILEEIDRPMENILASMNQTMRRNIRKLEKQGFSYIYTHEKEVFDLFYYRMYLPYITSRHQGQGMIIDDYESTLNTFTNGGLLLIMDGQEPVSGMICQLKGEICVARIMGVLEGEFDFVRRGTNVALWWFMLLWARKQGAHQFDFGGSRAYTSDGVFNFKRQWGTRVIPYKGIYAHWSFYTQKLPENFQEYLNKLGLITSLDGKFYRVILDGPLEFSSTMDIPREISLADKCGLEGLAVLSVQGKLQIIPRSRIEE